MKRCLAAFLCGLCLLGAVVARAADTDSLTQMILMIREGDEDALCAALKPLSLNAGIDAPDARGRTLLDYALCEAPSCKAVDMVNLLLANGADPRAVMDGGADALYQAASGNIRVDVLRYLVSLGLDVNSQLDENHDGLTPLMLAVRHNQNPQVIRCLLELGAKPDLRDAEGKTALQGASPERAAWLRQQGLEALLR